MPPSHTPATLLETFAQQGISLALAAPAPVAQSPDSAPVLPGLTPELCHALLLPGSVVELSAQPGTGAHSLALLLMAEALQRAQRRGRAGWLCAIDPSGTLQAPAVAQLGVPLTRLLVVVPPLTALRRLAVRTTKSGLFVGVLIDATGLDDLAEMPIAVRRLALAAKACGAVVFVLTDPAARRPQPLPTAARAELTRQERGVQVAFMQHRQGVRGAKWAHPEQGRVQRLQEAVRAPPPAPAVFGASGRR